MSPRLCQAFGFVLWLVCWSDLFYSFHELRNGLTRPPIYFVTPLVVGMTMVRTGAGKRGSRVHKDTFTGPKMRLITGGL